MNVTQSVDFKRAGRLYFIGNLFNKGIAFFTVPIFTRLLSTSDYGIVTTYNSWIAMLAMIVGFAMHTGIRIAFVDYKDRMNDFMATITTFTLLSGGIMSLIIFSVSRFVTFSINSTLIVLCLMQSIASALIEDYSMFLMMQYKYKFRTAIMVLPNLLSVCFSVIAIKCVLSQNFYLGRIIPTAIVFICFGLVICVLIYRKSYCILKKEYLKYALLFSSPLILHGIALNILSQSDRTMITWFADASQTGIYSLIYNFSMIATVITTSLEGIWVPWFYKKLQEKNIDDINLYANDYINLMTYTLVGVIMVGPEVVMILAKADYWDGIRIIPPVVISNFIIFAYSLFVNVEHFYKKTKGITLNTVIAAVTNIVLNYLFIPKFGYVAAAYTTLVSYFVSFVLHAFKSKELVPVLFPLRFFFLPMIEICIGTLLFYMFTDNMIVRWGIVILFEIMMIIKERKRIAVYYPNLPVFHRKQ